MSALPPAFESLPAGVKNNVYTIIQANLIHNFNKTLNDLNNKHKSEVNNLKAEIQHQQTEIQSLAQKRKDSAVDLASIRITPIIPTHNMLTANLNLTNLSPKAKMIAVMDRHRELWKIEHDRHEAESKESKERFEKFWNNLTDITFDYFEEYCNYCKPLIQSTSDLAILDDIENALDPDNCEEYSEGDLAIEMLRLIEARRKDIQLEAQRNELAQRRQEQATEAYIKKAKKDRNHRQVCLTIISNLTPNQVNDYEVDILTKKPASPPQSLTNLNDIPQFQPRPYTSDHIGRLRDDYLLPLIKAICAVEGITESWLTSPDSINKWQSLLPSAFNIIHNHLKTNPDYLETVDKLQDGNLRKAMLFSLFLGHRYRTVCHLVMTKCTSDWERLTTKDFKEVVYPALHAELRMPGVDYVIPKKHYPVPTQDKLTAIREALGLPVPVAVPAVMDVDVEPTDETSDEEMDDPTDGTFKG